MSHSFGIMETLLEYFNTPLIQKLTKREQVRCVLLLVGTVGISTLAVDVISGVPETTMMLATAAIFKSVFYTLGIILAEISISYFSRSKSPLRGVSVGKTWLISFAGFLLGYLLLTPYRQQFGHLEHHGADNDVLFFLKIIPIWILLTYVFIQFHFKKSLIEQVGQLQKINSSLLYAQEPHGQSAPHKKSDILEKDAAKVFFPGRENVELCANDISRVEVNEHYCTIYHLAGEVLRETEVKCSLKKMADLLIDSSVVHVHRSCMVNLLHIVKIDRIPRSYALHLKHTPEPVKISRYRIGDVLPEIEAYLTNMDSEFS